MRHHRSGSARIHHQRDIIAWIFKILGNGSGSEGTFHPLHRRLVGVYHNHKIALNLPDPNRFPGTDEPPGLAHNRDVALTWADVRAIIPIRPGTDAGTDTSRKQTDVVIEVVKTVSPDPVTGTG